MRHTISQRVLGACVLLLLSVTCVRAQPSTVDDPFADGRWHFQSSVNGALEAWNYNVSHEELYGLSEGLTYGLRDGLAVTMDQRISYVSQRANDSWLIGLTFGVRQRVYHRARVALFIEGGVGIADGAIAAPPRGTRFNYLAMGSAGALVRVRRRVQLLAGLQWIHVSNNSLKGPGRNPDIEAVGVQIGAVVGFD